MSEHQKVFVAASELYASGAKKEHILKKFSKGFLDFFGNFEYCLNRCQKAISIQDEYEEIDGDLASNLGMRSCDLEYELSDGRLTD